MTKIDQTFDEFITAAAELAIKHVTQQVKTVLQSMAIYVVGERDLEYNDSNHYFSGEGIIPRSFFLDREDAEKEATKLNQQGWWMTSGWHEVQDDNYQAREKLAMQLAKPNGREHWDVTSQEIYDYCVANKVNPFGVIPQVYQVVELQ